MNKSRLFSIKTRILMANISFVFIAFLGVILIFNLLMDNYISRTSKDQLSRVVSFQNNTEQKKTTTTDSSSSSSSSAPNLSDAPRGTFNTHPGTFTITSAYAITLPEGTSGLDKEISQEVADALKESHVSLDDLQNYRLETDGNTFYIEASKQSDGSYRLLYLDITGIVNFSHSVNLFLIIIALVVIVILSLAVSFVTQRLTRPLSRLVSFAKQIGQGDFTPIKNDFQDLELATLAETMNTSAVQLKDSNQNQTIFFQNASHELRTPLMSIKSYAEAITYDVMDPKEASQVILEETDRMKELVEDLLELSRLDNVKNGEEMDNYDLRKTLKDLAKEQSAVAKQKKIRFVYEFDKKPVVMYCNDKAMRCAISNLISNALRYAKTTIWLTCHVSADELILTVENDGPAVEEKDLPHLFERFYKGAGGVHGIGLAIVKTIVEQHEGKVSVETSQERTAFIMTFKSRKSDL